jgi:phage shock protein E
LKNPKELTIKYKLALLPISLLLISLLVKGNETVLIIDVRSDQEWSNGHLESAIHIPLSEIERKLEMLSEHKDSKIYLYCGAGRRAEAARRILSNAGFTNLTNAGGMKDASNLLNSEIIN